MYNSVPQSNGGNNFSVQIVEPIKVLNSWKGKFDGGRENFKELNMVSWNNRPAQLDLRNWYIDENGNKKAGKGVSLSENEAIELMHALQQKFPNR